MTDERRGTVKLDATHYAERSGSAWRVYSLASDRSYLTDPDAGTCTCPGRRAGGRECRHLVMLRQIKPGGGDSMSAKEEAASQGELVVADPEPREDDGRLLVPVADLARLKETVRQFGEITRSLLDPEDVVEISGVGEITRSGWDKVALAYNVSADILSAEPVMIGGRLAFRAKARVMTAGGRYSTGHGLCTVEEVRSRTSGKKRDPRELHFALATAESRALKRAMAGLVGAGDLTQEELAALRARK